MYNENPSVDISNRDMCSRCGKDEAEQKHTCPYRVELYGDSSYLCDCCGDCEDQCLMDT